MIRPWRKPPPPMWLDLADEMGVLTAGSLAVECMDLPIESASLSGWVENEVRESIWRDRNSTCVVQWELFNEITDRQPNLKRLLHPRSVLARQLDPTRPILDESGGWAQGANMYLPYESEPTKFNDIHDYPGPQINEEVYQMLLLTGSKTHEEMRAMGLRGRLPGKNVLAGQLYTFPFLDYAEDRSISVPAGGNWQNTTLWDGALHDDGYGHPFTSITQDNTFIIASVFASSGGYVDETAGYRLGSNRAPNAPSSPSPSNGSTNVKIDPILTWQGTDPDWFDTLYFDVYFEKDDSTPDVLVSDDQTGTSYNPGNLELESNYYWQIIVHDEYGLTVQGPIWHFTTRGNSPPNIPKNPKNSAGSSGVSRPKSVISMIRQAITRLIPMARRKRSAVS